MGAPVTIKVQVENEKPRSAAMASGIDGVDRHVTGSWAALNMSLTVLPGVCAPKSSKASIPAPRRNKVRDKAVQRSCNCAVTSDPVCISTPSRSMAPFAPKRRKLDQPSSHEGQPSAAPFSTAQIGAFDNGRGTASAVTNAAGTVKELDSGGTAKGAAGNMYSSNMFKLQMDELLAEMRPNYERRLKKVEKALHKLKAILERIPEQDALPVSPISKTYSSGQI